MRSFWSEFKAFLTRGNVLDLAVAFILGSAFTGVVKSLANDILMPFVALVTGDTDFTDRFVVLRDGSVAGPYATLAAARDGGAVVMSYGVFLNLVVAFILTALVLFFVIKYARRIMELRKQEEAPPAAPATKVCQYCRSKIDVEATRCAFCTAASCR